MEIMIHSGEELYNHFQHIHKCNSRLERDMHKLEAYVSSKVRKEVLCSFEQGKIILEGRVCRLKFDNLGGGVYLAYVGAL